MLTSTSLRVGDEDAMRRCACTPRLLWAGWGPLLRQAPRWTIALAWYSSGGACPEDILPSPGFAWLFCVSFLAMAPVMMPFRLL